LSGRDEEKVTRMEERFRRVNVFLEYLKREEQEEVQRFSLDSDPNSDFPILMDQIIEKYTRQSEYIRKRIKENNETYAEDRIVPNVFDGFDGILEDDSDDNIITKEE
jgi:hypothetical protein